MRPRFRRLSHWFRHSYYRYSSSESDRPQRATYSSKTLELRRRTAFPAYDLLVSSSGKSSPAHSSKKLFIGLPMATIFTKNLVESETHLGTNFCLEREYVCSDRSSPIIYPVLVQKNLNLTVAKWFFLGKAPFSWDARSNSMSISGPFLHPFGSSLVREGEQSVEASSRWGGGGGIEQSIPSKTEKIHQSS